MNLTIFQRMFSRIRARTREDFSLYTFLFSFLYVRGYKKRKN